MSNFCHKCFYKIIITLLSWGGSLFHQRQYIFYILNHIHQYFISIYCHFNILFCNFIMLYILHQLLKCVQKCILTLLLCKQKPGGQFYNLGPPLTKDEFFSTGREKKVSSLPLFSSRLGINYCPFINCMRETFEHVPLHLKNLGAELDIAYLIIAKLILQHTEEHHH